MSIVKGFMVPHPPLIVSEVGKGAEKQIGKTISAYKEVAKEIAEIKPDTIIISSPHADIYSDYFHILNTEYIDGSFERFNAPEVKFHETNDLELVYKIDDICIEKKFPGVVIKEKDDYLDHGCMVPLYFIRKYLDNFKVIIVSLSNESYIKHYKLGQIIKDAVNDLGRKCVFISSGDLSHKLQYYGPYGFTPEGPKYDKEIMDIMSKGDFVRLFELDKNLIEKACECGHRSFIIMAGAFDNLNVQSKMFSHEDVTGVGYGICSYSPQEENDNRKIVDVYLEHVKKELNKKYKESDEYILLAKEAIFEYINNNKIIDVPKNTSSDLIDNRYGVFVSIHKFGELRGCIGTIEPTMGNVAEEIIRNAISASTNDYRFRKVIKEELDFIDINVDVITNIENIKSIDELDVKKYGVIVSNETKRGVLLPDLEGIDNVNDQVRIATLKAGLKEDDEKKLQRFEVIRHK